MNEDYQIKDTIKQLPEKPGVYRFYDSGKELIYVGKAKSLKKRVSNYFNKHSHLDKKTQKLVSQIHSIEYTIVNSEFDAYLLENNLIKNFQPKYNILLKDDKTYPYLYVSNERFPRIISTRTFNRDWGIYYGPFSSVKAMNTVLELIRALYHLRTCNYNLSEQNIAQKKFKVCLEYHIGNCKGPCEGLQNEEIYNKNIEQVHHILKGNLSLVKNYFKNEIAILVEQLEFEKANLVKNKIEALDKYQSKSLITNPNITDLEVYAIVSTEKNAAVNFFSIKDGRILQTRNIEAKKKLNETDEDVLLLTIARIREEIESKTKEVITNIEVSFEQEHFNLVAPKIGDKKKLIELSEKNAWNSLSRSINEVEEKPNERVLKTLQRDLSLKEIPDHIECFDNSNIQGTNPVAAMVCFKNGRSAKKEYRHYNIKSVEGPDDFKSMYEIVTRRYSRLQKEELPFPKLIVIDGGKGQLNAACSALMDLGIYGTIPIIGIAKRLEEIYFPEDKDPIYIDKKSESLKLIQQIRNEAHRFAITFHRQKRSKSSLASKTKIPGIGEKTFELLLKEFKSINNINEAPTEDIANIIGKRKADIIKDYLNKNNI